MTSPTRLEAEENAACVHAATYEDLAVPALFSGWAASLVDLAEPAPGSHVLDVGCGTGIVARTTAAHMDRGARIVAIDSDAAMLAVAKQTAVEGGPRIRWQLGDAQHLPFDDATFDVIYCQQALQFFEDPDAALAEMHRVSRPGGQVAVGTWRGVRDSRAAEALGGALARHLMPEAIGELDAACAFGTPEALARRLSDAELELLHAGVLVQNVSVRSAGELIELMALITSLGPWLHELTADARRRLSQDLDRELRGTGPDAALQLPVEAAIAVGCK